MPFVVISTVNPIELCRLFYIYASVYSGLLAEWSRTTIKSSSLQNLNLARFLVLFLNKNHDQNIRFHQQWIL